MCKTREHQDFPDTKKKKKKKHQSTILNYSTCCSMRSTLLLHNTEAYQVKNPSCSL